MPGRHRLLADITPLRESAAFRRLWAGTTLSSVGSALTAFAVMLQVYDLSRSPFAVDAIGVAQMEPTLAVGLLGGPVTDAVDRRKLTLITSTGLAVVAAAPLAGAQPAGRGRGALVIARSTSSDSPAIMRAVCESPCHAQRPGLPTDGQRD